jgi:hypothetical protein
MRRCQFFTAALILLLVNLAAAQTPAPADLHVKLSFAENKTVYRIGEPIKLIMEFVADREGYVAEIIPDTDQPMFDTLVISPEQGITHWLDELNDNHRYMRDYFSTAKLGSVPQRIPIVLNDALRFDTPGRYTVSVETRRVSHGPGFYQQDKAIPLSTNALTFEVQAMSEADEAKEIKRFSDLFDAKRDPRSDQEITKQFSYLTGDASTREKVKRFLNPDQRGSSYNGLFIARTRPLVLKLVEAGMRDPSVPVTSQILHVATRLKMLLAYGMREKRTVSSVLAGEPDTDARPTEIRDAYVLELAAGLAKRTGESQTTTAMTVLSSLPKDTQTSSAALREVRRILVQQFDTLHAYSQEWLLRQYWEQLRDPALVPALKKILATADPHTYQTRERALDRLMEMAPDEVRPYVIAEIRNPNSTVDPKILGALKDESLAEVDTTLLEQIRTLATSPDNRSRVYLKFKVALLVRFATESIYPELMELYQAVGEKLSYDTRPGFLAYFAKHNEREAMPLIEQAISKLKPGEYSSLLSDMTALYYSDALGGQVKKLLETDDAATASNAAYVIGLHGFPGDEKVLEARLKRWREQWRDRVVEADAQQQGQIERELIYALINGKSWKLSPERVQELRTSCVTQMCKQSNLVRQ